MAKKSSKAAKAKVAKAAKAPKEGRFEVTYGDGTNSRTVTVDGPDWESTNARVVITAVTKVG